MSLTESILLLLVQRQRLLILPNGLDRVRSAERGVAQPFYTTCFHNNILNFMIKKFHRIIIDSSFPKKLHYK